jgi:DNA topoisomerase IA
VPLKLSEIHFRLLGVTPNSTKEDIRKAYIREIKKWHPDKFQNEPEKASEALAKSKELNEAYELLKDYDASTAKTYSKLSAKSGKPSTPHNRTRYRIRSLNVFSIAYNKQLNILEVEYRNGKVIQYPRVPETDFLDILQSEAKGKFIGKHMRFTKR